MCSTRKLSLVVLALGLTACGGNKLRANRETQFGMRVEPRLSIMGTKPVQMVGVTVSGPYLSCAATGWNWGDGAREIMESDCEPDDQAQWSSIYKRHEYKEPGMYAITFAAGLHNRVIFYKTVTITIKD